MSGVRIRASVDYGKAVFFGLLLLATLAVIAVDEKFLFLRADPEWAHIRPFQWWLLPHGLFGLAALLCGPLQFSDQLRAARPGLHKAVGYGFVVTGAVTAVMGTMITVLGFEPGTIYVEEYFHGGLIVLSLALAIVFILNKNVQAHKLWMMRAYLVLLIFVFARLPDLVGHQMSHQELSDVLWSGDVVGVLGLTPMGGPVSMLVHGGL